jgi:hypothetical protein
VVRLQLLLLLSCLPVLPLLLFVARCSRSASGVNKGPGVCTKCPACRLATVFASGFTVAVCSRSSRLRQQTPMVWCMSWLAGFCSDDDSLVLEDEGARMSMRSECAQLQPDSVVTGTRRVEAQQCVAAAVHMQNKSVVMCFALSCNQRVHKRPFCSVLHCKRPFSNSLFLRLVLPLSLHAANRCCACCEGACRAGGRLCGQ